MTYEDNDNTSPAAVAAHDASHLRPVQTTDMPDEAARSLCDLVAAIIERRAALPRYADNPDAVTGRAKEDWERVRNGADLIDLERLFAHDLERQGVAEPQSALAAYRLTIAQLCYPKTTRREQVRNWKRAPAH